MYSTLLNFVNQYRLKKSMKSYFYTSNRNWKPYLVSHSRKIQLTHIWNLFLTSLLSNFLHQPSPGWVIRKWIISLLLMIMQFSSFTIPYHLLMYSSFLDRFSKFIFVKSCIYLAKIYVEK